MNSITSITCSVFHTTQNKDVKPRIIQSWVTFNRVCACARSVTRRDAAPSGQGPVRNKDRAGGNAAPSCSAKLTRTGGIVASQASRYEFVPPRMSFTSPSARTNPPNITTRQSPELNKDPHTFQEHTTLIVRVKLPSAYYCTSDL